MLQGDREFDVVSESMIFFSSIFCFNDKNSWKLCMDWHEKKINFEGVQSSRDLHDTSVYFWIYRCKEKQKLHEFSNCLLSFEKPILFWRQFLLYRAIRAFYIVWVVKQHFHKEEFFVLSSELSGKTRFWYRFDTKMGWNTKHIRRQSYMDSNAGDKRHNDQI